MRLKLLLIALLLAGPGGCGGGGTSPAQGPPADREQGSVQWLSLRPGEIARVRGRVVDSGPRPVVGEQPYRDHILMLRLEGLVVDGRPRPGTAALIYVRSMRDNVITPEGMLRPGDTASLRVRPWSEVARFYQAIQRGDIERLWDRPVLWAEPENGGE